MPKDLYGISYAILTSKAKYLETVVKQSLTRNWQKLYLKTILTSVKATKLKLYTFTETVLCSIEELKSEFYGGPYYLALKICIGKRGGPYYPSWYNDMAIFNNLPSLQLDKFLYHLCR